MIRIVRGPEPDWLHTVREGGLAETRAALASALPLDLTGYERCRPFLYHAQRRKCAWCEKPQEPAYSDVDHYRPKSRYWWLAWTWNNLLFSCNECNRSWKRDQFPLSEGHPLLAEETPPGSERPLLLDPTVDNPEDHIIFQPIGHHWVPTARDGSRRGFETIRLLGLNRQTLLDIYSDHVRSLGDSIRHVQHALERGDVATIRQVWKAVMESRLRSDDPASAYYVALTRDVFAHHFSKEVRERWQLDFPT